MTSIETRLDPSIGYPSSRLRAPENDDDASTIIPLARDDWDRDMSPQSIWQKNNRGEHSPDRIDISSSRTDRLQSSSRGQDSLPAVFQQIVQFDPTLESELYASRVYSRNAHWHSVSSLYSTEKSATGLSFLSGISLAQISNLSVISLPIFCHELWNAQQYKIPGNSHTSDSLVAEFPLPERLRDTISGVKCSSVPPAESMVGLIKNGDLLEGLLTSPPKAKATAESMLSAQTDHKLKSEKRVTKEKRSILMLGK